VDKKHGSCTEERESFRFNRVFSLLKEENYMGQMWWVTLVISVTWEVETAVLGQPGQKSLRDPISTEKMWAWWHTLVVPAMTGSIK
jgi:hypothetical protein